MNAVGQANPFSDASEFNMLDFIIARATDEMQTVSVGEVIAVNTGAQTVDVQILVNLVTGANTPVEHEVIAGRPYFRLQGGGNAIICDPVVGDIGVVVFASRDITGVVAAKSAANPSSNRRFSWSDGIYLGGILNGAPTQYMQFLAAGGGINIVSPGTVAIQAPATTASGTLNVTGNTTLQATLAVTGTSTLTGAVSAPGGLTTTTIAGASAVFSGSVTASSFIGGGGGGGGTVTSVGISTPGVGVVVGGGPITTAGTLTVDLSSTAYAALALAVTALQSISIATGTGLTGGPLAASGSTVALANTAVTPGSYTSANITVDAQGRLTAAASGTGGSALNNLNPDLHPATPTGIGLGPNDEFETGSTIDTTGTRYSGATAWTAFNATGYTTAISGDGSLVLTNASNTTSLCGGFQQPLPGSGTWAYTAKISLRGATAGGGLFLATSSGASGHIICHLVTGNGGVGNVVQYNTNATTFSANLFTGGTYPQAQGTFPWVYMQISFDGTNLHFATSFTGAVGSFVTLYSETPAAHLGTPAMIGITQGTPDTFSTICDWFRRTA